MRCGASSAMLLYAVIYIHIYIWWRCWRAMLCCCYAKSAMRYEHIYGALCCLCCCLRALWYYYARAYAAMPYMASSIWRRRARYIYDGAYAAICYAAMLLLCDMALCCCYASAAAARDAALLRGARVMRARYAALYMRDKMRDTRWRHMLWGALARARARDATIRHMRDILLLLFHAAINWTDPSGVTIRSDPDRIDGFS